MFVLSQLLATVLEQGGLIDKSRGNPKGAFVSLPTCDCGSRKDHHATLPCRIREQMEVPVLPQGIYHSRAKEGSTEQVEMTDMEETDLQGHEQWTPRGHSGAGPSCKKNERF